MKEKKIDKLEYLTTSPFTRPEIDEWTSKTDLRIVQIIMKINQIIDKLSQLEEKK